MRNKKLEVNDLMFGDYIKVVVKDNREERELYGYFVSVSTNKNETFLTLKLDNGYNIGIDSKKIKRIDVLEKSKVKYEKNSKDQDNKSMGQSYAPSTSTNHKLPMVAILFTGGTIASKVDYNTGAVTALFEPEDILAMYPEIKAIANIRCRKILNIMSENIRFEHYNSIAKAIQKEIDEGCDAIIIAHGTDTMHYTASALHYMLKYLPVPVVIVGSQRSADRPSSDAFLNLINAIFFAINSHYRRVTICMHETIDDDYCIILNPINARKMHTSRRDAFRNINTTPIARVSYHKKIIEYFDSPNKDEDLFIKKGFEKPNKVFEIAKFKPSIKVGLLKAYPNIDAELLDVFKDYDGLVIEGTGLGHLPISQHNKNIEFFNKLKSLIENGLIVVIASQCLYGRVNLNVYAVGRELKSIGVKGHLSNLTPETSYIKLSWLLSNYKKDYVKKHFEELWQRLEFS